MKVFDSHVNLSESGRWFKTDLDASYERAVDALDESNIGRAVLLAMPGTCTNSVFENSNIDRERFWCFGNIDMDRINYSIDQIKELELDGVKFHPRVQGFGLDQLLDMPFLYELDDLGLPLMICGWQQSTVLPIASLSPLHVDSIAKRHPTLKIILSHLGGHRFWDAFTVARSNPMVYLDCSYFLHHFNGTSLVSDFFSSLHMIDEKVIYGSDFPEVDPSNYLNLFYSGVAATSAAKQSNVLYRNLERFLLKGAI